jgi:hypothetical protein
MLATVQKLCIAVAVLGFSTTIGVLSMTPPLFGVAKICLLGAAVLLAACVIVWVSSSDDAFVLKAILGAVAGIAILAGTPQLFSMINDKQRLAMPPQIAIRFVYPENPSLQILNLSDVTARDIRYGVGMWNMNKLDKKNTPLPIPSGGVDFLRPRQAGGPLGIFSVIEPIDQGAELFGSINIQCPDCLSSKTYVVYIVWGQGGWYGQNLEITDGIIIPKGVKLSDASSSDMSDFANFLVRSVPEARRAKIETPDDLMSIGDELPAQ